MAVRGDSRMGLFSCVALIIGACIGSAIVSISGVTIAMAGPAAILSWVLAAGIFGLYGMVVVRLASLYPHSGGIYVFPRLAFGGRVGRTLGFFSGWGYVVSNTIAISFSAIYVGVYTSPAWSFAAMALAFALVFGRLRSSQAVQNLMVILLAAILLIFSGVSLFGDSFSAAAFSDFFGRGSLGRSGFISAIPLAMVAYGGCVVIAFMASDVRRSSYVPLSMAIGLLVVVVIYVFVLVAMTGTSSQLVSSGTSPLDIVFKIGCVLALLTTMVALLRVNVRTLEAMSAEGLLPSRSIAVMALVALGLCFLPRQAGLLISLGAVLNIVSITITCLALYRSRRSLFPLLIVALLWACYIPGLLHGESGMWIFTGGIYLVGVVMYILRCPVGAGHDVTETSPPTVTLETSPPTCSGVSHTLSGVVVHGKGHGHLHGMPTANLQPYPGAVLPKNGVWSTKVFIDGAQYRGMTSVGPRPSDDSSPEVTVETFILDDFSEDIYGRELTLEFVRYIRPIRKFADLDALRAQIDEDISTALRPENQLSL